MFRITSGRRYLGGEARSASARQQKTREMAIVGSRCDRDSHHVCLADRRSSRLFVRWRLPGAVVEDPPGVENHDYDPAAAYFFSMLSFGAMSLITPTVFGDFQSPVVVSQAPQLSRVMPEGAGLDPGGINNAE